MAAEPEKSGGLKFAEQQLLRHGWQRGKGLGRAENGISEALKVKVKCDKGGVGHKEGEQFTFHWWDHVFNKASSSLQVESDQNGIKVKKTVEDDEEDGMISNKKPRKAFMAKGKLYGCFVKSATLLSGEEQPEPKSDSDDSSSSSSSSEEEDQRLDLSSTTKLSDADLMKACGGRTAHKGARHGLTMSAKLARLEQQEAEFMAKWGKKSQSASSSQTPPTSQSDTQEEVMEDCVRKEKKKKKGKQNGDDISGSPETEIKQKKKRKTDEERTDGVSTEAGLICDHKKTKRKRKKNEDEGKVSPAAESPEAKAEQHADVKVKQKKKKKKSLSRPDSEEEQNNDNNQSDQRILEEAEVKKTKKQKKSNKDKLCAESSKQEEEEEEHPPKKKKKKSRD